jgi:hypothetical protein
VWYTINAWGIGQFFYEIINYEHYAKLILTFFELMNENKKHGHFMQNNATAHTASEYVCKLKFLVNNLKVKDCVLPGHLI